MAEAYEILTTVATIEGVEGTPYRKSKKFKFDDFDESARWAQMKAEFAENYDPNMEPIGKNPVHKTAPEPVAPVAVKLYIMLIISFAILIFRRDIFPFPEKESEKYSKINEKYKAEGRANIEKGILRRIEQEEKLREEERRRFLEGSKILYTF